MRPVPPFRSLGLFFALINLVVYSVFPQAIVIDHNCANLSQIPAYWLEQAKQLKLHYAHTSHGGQLLEGAEALENYDSYYSYAVGYSCLPAESGALCIFDGQESETYITPGLYWEEPAGRQYTRDVLDNNPSINFSMWAWCGQVSYYATWQVQSYLEILDQFETEYPSKRFIYMTGHLDGTGSSGALHVHNQTIRNYCAANNKILFDFADIERYDPNGTDYLDLGGGTGGDGDGCEYDSGNWGVEWCAANPASPLCDPCPSGCAHSRDLNCNLKARAFWWMMARLAGWDGQTRSSTTPVLDSGDYNGDGTADIGIFRAGSGLWSIRGVTRVYFGSTSDIPVSGDYDGDGTTDISIFRGSSGLWGIRSVTRAYFGSSAGTAVPGDYDGDGSTDVGIFRGGAGLWAIRGVTRVYLGSSGDRPVPGDYDGDGSKEIALFRPASGLWAIRGFTRLYFGDSGCSLAPGDYDGDGTWKCGIFRPTSGLWAIREVTRLYFGGVGDVAVPADFEGDGVDDIGVFRGSSGLWGVKGVTRAYFGTTGDLPVTR